MNRTQGSRRSPTLLATALVLVAALAGTAIAGPEPAKRAVSKKTVKKVAKKLAKKQIKRKAPTLSVRNAAELGDVPAADYALRSELGGGAETGLTLNDGWVNLSDFAPPGTPIGPARAFRDASGVVHLAGTVSRAGGTIPVALVLPSEFRPAVDHLIAAVCDEPGSLFDPRPGVVSVKANGEVRGLSNSDSNCTERLALDGVSYKAAG